jgi:hypothetical protein
LGDHRQAFVTVRVEEGRGRKAFEDRSEFPAKIDLIWGHSEVWLGYLGTTRLTAS